MGSAAAIYLRLVGSRVRSQTQYRVSFALAFAGTILVTGLDLVNILVFFHHVPALGGWSLREVVFLYAASLIGMRAADAAVGHVERLPQLIRSGEFDTFLMRPFGSLFQLLSSDFTLRQLGGVVQGAVVFTWAAAGLGIVWTPARTALLASMLVTSVAMFAGVFILTNSIAFWLIDTREVANAFTYGGNFMSQYPLHIFGEWIRRFFTVVVPIAFVNYFPALAILGRDDPFGSPRALRYIGPVVAAAVLLAARVVWRAGVRHYRSTGS